MKKEIEGENNVGNIFASSINVSGIGNGDSGGSKEI
jgi:hypothetical protein